MADWKKVSKERGGDRSLVCAQSVSAMPVPTLRTHYSYDQSEKLKNLKCLKMQLYTQHEQFYQVHEFSMGKNVKVETFIK